MEENKKTYIFYILGVLAIVALGGAVWYGSYLKKHSVSGPQAPTDIQEALKYAPNVQLAKPGQLPVGWPTDLPLFGKSKMIQSQNQQSPGSNFKVEALVVFLSSQKIKDVYASYAAWAKANKWTVDGSLGDVSRSMSLSKDSASILVTINTYQKTQSMVSIYYKSY